MKTATTVCVLVLLSLPVLADSGPWQAPSRPLPARLHGPALESAPVRLGNPFLQHINDNLYVLPWAPGEALVLKPKPGTNLNALGLWNGPREYRLLTREQGVWQEVSSAGKRAPADRVVFFGQELESEGAWSATPRLLVVGQSGLAGLQVERVPLFGPACAWLVLDRAAQELDKAEQYLRWMQTPPPVVTARVQACRDSITAARKQLSSDTQGLLQSYLDLPDARYAAEVVLFYGRIFKRTGQLERIGELDEWTDSLYGHPEFQPCFAARQAVQEALWAERSTTIVAEASRVYGAGAGYAASLTHGLVKFRRDKPFPEPLRTHYRATLARGEHESFQVPVIAFSQPLRQVEVAVQWDGPGPHPEVTLRPVGYVPTKADPDNFAEYVGWWPDPLLPPGPVDVAANEVQPIWGTLEATHLTRPGEHTATVVVTSAGRPPLRLKLEARVLDFDLGHTRLPSLLSLRFPPLQAFYKLDRVTQEIKRRWYAFTLEYRMNPNNIYSGDFYPEAEDVAFCRERGLNAMVMTVQPLKLTTRNNTSNLQVWFSDDNQAWRQAPAGWTASHDRDGNLVLNRLQVTARYLKLHSLCEDESYEMATKTLEAGRMVADAGGDTWTGPLGYAGNDDGSKPLASWGASWGAALDYKRTSLGVDLGQTRSVTRIKFVVNVPDTLEKVRHFAEVARANGLGDRAYVYGFDEWEDTARYGEIKATYDLIKRVAPSVKPCSTVVHPVAPIDQVIEAWCPVLCRDYPAYRDARKRGQEVWYYAGGAPYSPFPTHELLDVEAVEARAFFWPAWRYQYTGWLHWELNNWGNQNTQGDQRWPQVPWDPARSGVRNGEMGRIYPGPDATPLPSIRLENMRDGIEDYDYFWLLRDASTKLLPTDPRRRAVENLLVETIAALCPSRGRFERDPQKVLQAHERLGKTLEELLRKR